MHKLITDLFSDKQNTDNSHSILGAYITRIEYPDKEKRQPKTCFDDIVFDDLPLSMEDDNWNIPLLYFGWHKDKFVATLSYGNKEIRRPVTFYEAVDMLFALSKEYRIVDINNKIVKLYRHCFCDTDDNGCYEITDINAGDTYDSDWMSQNCNFWNN